MVNILNNSRTNNRNNNNNNNNNNSNMSRRGGDRGSTTSRGEGNKIYVSNIDFTITHQELKDTFKQVGEVAFVEMIKDDTQKFKGCAIIRFKENNIAEEAIRMMNRQELKGRKLVVKDEKEAPRDNKLKDRKRGREDDYFERSSMPSMPSMSLMSNMPSMPSMSSMSSMSSMPSMQSMSYDKFGNTYGLSTQFLESLGIDGPLVDRVFVANLDYTVDEETLKEVFSIAGKVIDVELVKGDDGKSKGFGFIEFDHPVEAVQAISMLHNQLYLDRPMSVQLTRKEKRRKDGSLRLPAGLKSIGPGLGINGNPLKDVARTIEAGNQSSLLGAMPAGTGNLSVGMDMGGINPALTGGLGSAFGGGLQGGGMLSASLGTGMMGSMASGLGSGVSGGMGLMDRSSGLSQGLQQSSNSSYSTFSGTPFSSQRNQVQISNICSTTSDSKGGTWRRDSSRTNKPPLRRKNIR